MRSGEGRLRAERSEAGGKRAPDSPAKPFRASVGSASQFAFERMRDLRAAARGLAPIGADSDGGAMRQADGLRRSADTARQLAVRRDLLRRFVVEKSCQSCKSCLKTSRPLRQTLCGLCVESPYLPFLPISTSKQSPPPKSPVWVARARLPRSRLLADRQAHAANTRSRTAQIQDASNVISLGPAVSQQARTLANVGST